VICSCPPSLKILPFLERNSCLATCPAKDQLLDRVVATAHELPIARRSGHLDPFHLDHLRPVRSTPRLVADMVCLAAPVQPGLGAGSQLGRLVLSLDLPGELLTCLARPGSCPFRLFSFHPPAADRLSRHNRVLASGGGRCLGCLQPRRLLPASCPPLPENEKIMKAIAITAHTQEDHI
jgi:hypothetical protein